MSTNLLLYYWTLVWNVLLLQDWKYVLVCSCKLVIEVFGANCVVTDQQPHRQQQVCLKSISELDAITCALCIVAMNLALDQPDCMQHVHCVVDCLSFQLTLLVTWRTTTIASLNCALVNRRWIRLLFFRYDFPGFLGKIS